MEDVLALAKNASTPALFYWWDPDPLLAKYPALPFTADPYSSTCGARFTADPNLSGADCLMNNDFLKTLMNEDAMDAALENFFKAYGFDNDQQRTMMALEVRGGGAGTTREAACAWLRGNEPVWRAWVTETSCPPGAVPVNGTCSSCPVGTYAPY